MSSPTLGECHVFWTTENQRLLLTTLRVALFDLLLVFVVLLSGHYILVKDGMIAHVGARSAVFPWVSLVLCATNVCVQKEVVSLTKMEWSTCHPVCCISHCRLVSCFFALYKP